MGLLARLYCQTTVVVFAALWSVPVLLQLLLMIIQDPKGLFFEKKRTEVPACLSKPALGKHHTVRLQVSVFFQANNQVYCLIEYESTEAWKNYARHKCRLVGENINIAGHTERQRDIHTYIFTDSLTDAPRDRFLRHSQLKTLTPTVSTEEQLPNHNDNN